VPIADRSLVYDPLADEGSLFAQHRCELIRDAALGLTIRAAGSKPVVAGNSPQVRCNKDRQTSVWAQRTLGVRGAELFKQLEQLIITQ
jgi:hypothetical protein